MSDEEIGGAIAKCYDSTGMAPFGGSPPTSVGTCSEVLQPRAESPKGELQWKHLLGVNSTIVFLPFLHVGEFFAEAGLFVEDNADLEPFVQVTKF